MASEKEIAESNAVSWYVSRTVELPNAAEIAELPEQVSASNGVVLSITSAAEVPSSAKYVIKAYTASLTIPGLIRAKLPVEVELVSFAPNVVVVGIRPSDKALRYPISAERYFDATWSVLDELEAAVAAEGALHEAAAA
jgi:hypothetical protein